MGCRMKSPDRYFTRSWPQISMGFWYWCRLIIKSFLIKVRLRIGGYPPNLEEERVSTVCACAWPLTAIRCGGRWTDIWQSAVVPVIIKTTAMMEVKQRMSLFTIFIIVGVISTFTGESELWIQNGAWIKFSLPLLLDAHDILKALSENWSFCPVFGHHYFWQNIAKTQHSACG
jgi:hypothetical protein